MMRQEYIAGLEEIRKRMIEIGQAFAAVDLTDATGMERDRRKKTAKLVGDLADRLYEDIAISAKVAADKAEAGQGEQDDLFAAADRKEKAKGATKPTAAEAEAAKPKAEEAEVVEVKMLPAPKPEEPADDPFNGAARLPEGDDPKPGRKSTKKSGKGKSGKGKKNGKKGGAK